VLGDTILFRMYLYQLLLSQTGFTASLIPYILVGTTYYKRSIFGIAFVFHFHQTSLIFSHVFFVEVWNGVASP